MPFIELEHVSMIFRVREQYQITLKEYLLRGMFRRSANPVMEVRALQDVSLCFGDGDRVGIIGGNGAGENTLFPFLAGLYYPTPGCRNPHRPHTPPFFPHPPFLRVTDRPPNPPVPSIPH